MATLTTITPLPTAIQRETVLRFLHDHDQMITLNPLVTRHEPTLPPAGASQEERENCKWYEMTDEIAYLPGGLWKSEISYKGGFYDLPDGLQTHVFAPAGVDLRGLWKVGGNLPGEPRAPTELGVDVPRDCLYLREDVELHCNFLLAGFVKKNLKKSHGVLVKTLIEKATDLQYTPADMVSPVSPSGPHPCFCNGPMHVDTCAEYPGAVQPRNTQRLSRLKDTGSITPMDVAKTSGPSAPTFTIPGPSTVHESSDTDSPLWFRPQLSGLPAELPAHTPAQSAPRSET